jgi:multidrug transporter EmrE-like cation transporter
MREKKNLFALTLVLICVLAGAAGQILWKHGMSNLDEINGARDLIQIQTIYNIFTDKYVFLGTILYGIALILWLGAMSTLEISFMYPMLSMGYVITAIFAFAFLGEQVGSIRWLGIALVVVGCFLITKS